MSRFKICTLLISKSKNTLVCPKGFSMYWGGSRDSKGFPLHTFRKKCFLRCKHCASIFYPEIFADSYSPNPRVIHIQLLEILSRSEVLGSPCSKIFEPVIIVRHLDGHVWVPTFSHHQMPDTVINYFITEGNSQSGKKIICDFKNIFKIKLLEKVSSWVLIYTSIKSKKFWCAIE